MTETQDAEAAHEGWAQAGNAASSRARRSAMVGSARGPTRRGSTSS